jgi:hypothetical protein
MAQIDAAAQGAASLQLTCPMAKASIDPDGRMNKIALLGGSIQVSDRKMD